MPASSRAACESPGQNPEFTQFFVQRGALYGPPFAYIQVGGTILVTDAGESSDLLRQAAAGKVAAREALFARHSDRLLRMVRLRLSRRLQGRVDEGDVVQEALLEAARKLNEYLQNPQAPFFLWLRHLTGLKLAELHRHHLGTQMRDADREVSIYRGALPEANSVSLAAH